MWVKHDDDFKERLENAFEPLFIELKALGVARHFSQALLFYGREFVDSLGTVEEIGKVKNDKIVTVKDVELIFGVTGIEMDDKAIREAKLAKKHNALAWESVSVDGNKVKIRVLTYKKK